MTRILLALLVLLTAVPAAEAGVDPLRRTPVVVAVERATPAVVTVKVEVAVSSPFALFGADSRASEGSGVIISPDGVVLTNAHVVDGARRIDVHLADGRMFAADLVAQDASIDLAVLRLQGASGLPTIRLGDSSDLMLGEPVIAIGNPFGLGLTVSTGIVASTGRDVNVGRGPTQTYIQTDAAINPGNSGGALVNIHGELVGINTFIHSAGEGIGFAIPVNRARKIADDLLAFGEVQIPWLGALLVDVPRGRQGEGGVLVRRVLPGGPAEAAGLRPGDLIVQLDEHRVLTRADINARLAEHRPGETVGVAVVRDQATRKVGVRTGRASPDAGLVVLREGLGVSVRPVRGGLEVVGVAPQGSFARAGLRVGDVIVGVDGRRTSTEADLVARLAEAITRHRASAWVVVARGPYQGTIELGL